ncbi:MAG TPA: hypothetical protein VIE65_12930 [Methylobacter sp.]|jgi:hypothetical protein
MTEAEFNDLVKLHALDATRPSMRVAYRVHVKGEKNTDAAKLENVNYQTAVNSIATLKLKYEIYLKVKERIIKEYLDSQADKK